MDTFWYKLIIENDIGGLILLVIIKSNILGKSD